MSLNTIFIFAAVTTSHDSGVGSTTSATVHVDTTNYGDMDTTAPKQGYEATTTASMMLSPSSRSLLQSAHFDPHSFIRSRLLQFFFE